MLLLLTVTRLLVSQHRTKDWKPAPFSITLVHGSCAGEAWVEVRDLAANAGEEMQARLGQRTHA